MEGNYGYRNRKGPICSKIRSLLALLAREPSKYDQLTRKIEYWIEYVLREGFVTVDELVEGVLHVALDDGGSFADVGRFLKEFRDAPNRSEQARSFIAQLCLHALRWFAIGSAEDTWWSSSVLFRDRYGFIRVASFVGNLIEWGLLSRELVQRHLKPFINNYLDGDNTKYSAGLARACAIYQLFDEAGNTLLRGLLETEDVQACFSILDAKGGGISQWIKGFDRMKVKEFHEIHAAWLQLREEEKGARVADERQTGAREGGTIVVESSTDVDNPVAPTPQNPPITTADIKIPPSMLQDVKSISISCGTDSSPGNFINAPPSTVSSPTLSISTLSDWTPMELSEEPGRGRMQMAARHDTFYFEDGNVEILCEETLFRVHSTIVSFSSQKLRDILSQGTLLAASTPEGCPRITLSDSADDFSILLKMIYTPGYPPRHEVPKFNVFASLLRMTTKYDFSNIRSQLIKDIEGAYPTKWEDFRGAKILGEDVFGSPRPHPNAVLNLLETQSVRFAIPFAAYRASIGGFSSLASEKPGTVLRRHILATAVHGMHVFRSLASQAARRVACGGDLWVCPDKKCALSVGINPTKPRMEALEKVYHAIVDEPKEGGLLSPPSLGHLLCGTCVEHVEGAYATWLPIGWEILSLVFGVSNGWEDA